MRHGIKMLYMGEPIEPYNGFYCNVTEQFMRPTLGGGWHGRSNAMTAWR